MVLYQSEFKVFNGLTYIDIIIEEILRTGTGAISGAYMYWN